MKFLFVGASHLGGGAEAHFVTMTRSLAAAGHVVEAVVYPDAPVARALAESPVRLHPARFRNALDPRGCAATLAAVRQLRPDWLVGDTGKEHLALILIGRMCGVPVALIRHRPDIKAASARLVMRRAQRFFATSSYARGNYIRRGMPAARVQVLYNPVDTGRFRPDPLLREASLASLGLDEQAIVLGCFGRLHSGKGIFVLLEAVQAAMAREPRLHCLWVGDGADARELEERIARSPFARRHRRIGWVDDTHPYYNALSLLALPSIIPESFGRTSVEAQACGVPVLGSDVGGIPETLKPGITGLLVPPGNVDAWRDAILMLCEDPARRPMAGAARDFVQRQFSATVIAAEFVRLLGHTLPRNSDGLEHR